MERRLRALIAGTGKMGRTHASAYRNMGHVEIAAAVDRDPVRSEAFAAEFQCAAFASMDEAPNAGFDFADICLPSPLHRDAAILCLRSGMHVICEKPLALAAGDAEEMARAANETGRALMTAQVVRFWPEYAGFAAIVRRGGMRDIRSLSLWRYGGPPDWSEGNWLLDDRKTGGILYDLCIHDVDFVQWLFGPPLWVFAHKSMLNPNYIAYMSIELGYEGMNAHVEGGFVMPGGYPFTAGFRASYGDVSYEYENRSGPGLRCFRQGAGESVIPCGEGDPYENELRYFTGCLLDGRRPDSCTPAESVALLKTLKHIERSVELKRVVEIARHAAGPRGGNGIMGKE